MENARLLWTPPKRFTSRIRDAYRACLANRTSVPTNPNERVRDRARIDHPLHTFRSKDRQQLHKSPSLAPSLISELELAAPAAGLLLPAVQGPSLPLGFPIHM